MILYIDSFTGQLVQDGAFKNPVTLLEFKNADATNIALRFSEEPVATGARIIKFGIKPFEQFDSPTYLVYTDTFFLNPNDPQSYILTPSFVTSALSAALSGNKEKIVGSGEFTWSNDAGLTWNSSQTVPVDIHNDVIKGGETYSEPLTGFYHLLVPAMASFNSDINVFAPHTIYVNGSAGKIGAIGNNATVRAIGNGAGFIGTGGNNFLNLSDGNSYINLSGDLTCTNIQAQSAYFNDKVISPLISANTVIASTMAIDTVTTDSVYSDYMESLALTVNGTVVATEVSTGNVFVNNIASILNENVTNSTITNLGVTTLATIQDLDVTTNTDTDTLNVAGLATILDLDVTNTLDVGGITTVQDLNVTTNTDTNTLNVASLATIQDLDVTTNTDTVNLGVVGTATISTIVAGNIYTNGTGSIGIRNSSPTSPLDIAADNFRVRTAKTPATATAAGITGQWCWDSGFIYICVGSNQWKRAAIATW